MAVEVSNFDVLCGKDKRSFNWPGNRKFRDEVHRHLEEYKNAKRREKAEIADIIEANCCEDGGRFLRPDENGLFHELDRKGIREKITHALRDAARKQLETAAGATRRQRYAQKQLVNRAAKRNNSSSKAATGKKDHSDDGEDHHDNNDYHDDDESTNHTETSMPPTPSKVPSNVPSSALSSSMVGGAFPPGMSQHHRLARQRMPNMPVSPGEAAIAARMMAAGMLPPGGGAAAAAAAAARFPMELGGPPHHPRLGPRGSGAGGGPHNHRHGGPLPPSMNHHPAAAIAAAAQANAAAVAAARLQQAQQQLHGGGGAMGGGGGEAQQAQAQRRIAALMEQVQSLEVMSAMRDKEMATLRIALVEATKEAKAKDLEIRQLREALALKDRALYRSNNQRSHTEDPPEDP